MHTTPPTHPSLLIRLHNHVDRDAWQQFVAVYAPLIFDHSRRKGLQESDAADVVQEVLLRVAAAFQRGAYDSSRGTFRGWLHTITQHAIADSWNRQARCDRSAGGTTAAAALANLPAMNDQLDWDQEYESRLVHWATTQVRTEVTPRTWTAFWRTAMEGRSGQETATELGLTLAAVYLAKGRVVRRLRELVATVDHDLTPFAPSPTPGNSPDQS